jgi:hypothetical protein
VLCVQRAPKFPHPFGVPHACWRVSYDARCRLNSVPVRVHDFRSFVDDRSVLAPAIQYDMSNAKGYFAEHLAVGEYYSEGQVVAGEWLGIGARLLSLNGPVKEAQFLALCDNLDPNTGENLTVRRKSKREVVNADQSVSEVANRS